MRKTKMMLLGVLLATAGASWTATAAGIDQYALKEFTADFTQFHIGDTVPAMYLTPEYNIKQWQQRNLPAPDAGSHWTYMGGNYVLITDTEGKILKVYDGEIFYHRSSAQSPRPPRRASGLSGAAPDLPAGAQFIVDLASRRGVAAGRFRCRHRG